MQENILAVDLSTEQVLEVNLPEQDNVAQIDVYWQDEVTLDLDLSLMYIVSGQREIQDYVDNKSKPEIDDYIETYAKPIVSEVVEEIAAPVVGDYIENVTKPDIKEFADKEMASYAQVAGEQAAIATNQADLAKASALASSETLTSVNNKAEEFEVAVNTAKIDIQSATDTSITNINNTVSAEIIPNLEGYVSTATNQAIIATSKANEAQSSANASKTSETNAQSYSDQAKGYAESVNPERFLNKEMITNCITEIPQDIKLELNNGRLTLKAGSKVYVPNGLDGTTPKFDTYTETVDKTISLTDNSSQFICVDANTGSLQARPVQNSVSGAGATTTYGLAYNTTTNKIRFYNADGVDRGFNNSLPIAIVTVSGGKITSIDQVFNGFGYVGSTVFALPNVKGLIPNGRNADGTLKNEEFVIDKVLTYTNSVTSELDIMLTQTGLFDSAIRKHDVESNFVYNTSTGGKEFVCSAGSYTRTSGVISNFSPKLPFRAVDYNEASGLSMPSGKYINLTLGASGSNYKAPANGWFTLQKVTGSANLEGINLYNQTSSNMGVTCYLYGTKGYNCNATVQAKKGDIIYISYNASGDVKQFRFIYAEGDK